MGDALGAGDRRRGLRPFLDVGRRPDGVEGLVEPEARIDIARKFIGLGDDRLQRGADEGVAMRLAAGQGAGVAAKERQVRSKFLAKGHEWLFSLEIHDWRRLWRRVDIVATLEGPSRSPFAAPREVKLLWNKAPAIWFPWLGRASCKADQLPRSARPVCIETCQTQVWAVAPESGISMTRALMSALGGTRS